MASFRSEAEAFSGMSGMVEGHARRATGLKPRALARGVGSFVPTERVSGGSLFRRPLDPLVMPCQAVSAFLTFLA
jgi:hypothetical protein